MENVWGPAEVMRTDALSAEGEYLEAEVIDGGGADGPKRRRDPRIMRASVAFLVAVYAISMVGGYVGGGALYATIGAVDSLMVQLSGGDSDGAQASPVAGGVPMGCSAVTADGLRISCAGSYVRQAKGEGGEPLVVVALEVQNISDEKVVLRKDQFAAVAADGGVVESLDQRISRDDESAFYQFTSVIVEPGERLTVCSSFYEAANPAQATYAPRERSRNHGADRTAFEIGGMQETMLA